MNVFEDLQIAQTYDLYDQTSLGESVDHIEKALIRGYLDQILSREMLELGCATGHWTEFSAKTYSEIKAGAVLVSSF